jgi:hypothetical protein
MMLLLCSSLLTVIADREAPAESKALIKLTLYSPCSYPMLFSCQKSSAVYGRPLWSGKAAISRQFSAVTKFNDNRQLVTDNLFSGGADRDRTGDPLVANQVLSQLSYSPILVASGQWLVISQSLTTGH